MQSVVDSLFGQVIVQWFSTSVYTPTSFKHNVIEAYTLWSKAVKLYTPTVIGMTMVENASFGEAENNANSNNCDIVDVELCDKSLERASLISADRSNKATLLLTILGSRKVVCNGSTRFPGFVNCCYETEIGKESCTICGRLANMTWTTQVAIAVNDRKSLK
ncbi:hypothetical protein MIR68_004975 [Amoeboaphelidium protococcarum]|nr:hypothetical protein MIR68_004975 [Amoeboaphelidium protococcarum]